MLRRIRIYDGTPKKPLKTKNITTASCSNAVTTKKLEQSAGVVNGSYVSKEPIARVSKQNKQDGRCSKKIEQG
jgi:hypothetical protein